MRRRLRSWPAGPSQTGAKNRASDPLTGRGFGANHARLWQWTALLHRALDEHANRLNAFADAARLAPDDASIAHGHARVALEAGLDARQLFDRALRLGPGARRDLGPSRCPLCDGRGGAAAAELAAILDCNPLWGQGHVQWAQLASMNGRPGDAMMTIERALADHRGEISLWHAAIHILVGGARNAEAWVRADAAIDATGDAAAFALTARPALSDAGEVESAEAAFGALGEPRNVGHAVRLARHLIRTTDWAALSALADRWMEGEDAHLFWPYASIAWRQSGDMRWQWLEGDEAGSNPRPEPEAAAARRAGRSASRSHARAGRFLDQSVRGGTQTDGPLLSRIEPEIRALRSAIVAAVDDYRANLPARILPTRCSAVREAALSVLPVAGRCGCRAPGFTAIMSILRAGSVLPYM